MKKIYSIILTLILVLSTSCEQDSFFELDRSNQAPWQNVSELELAVRSPYLFMSGKAWTNPLGMLPLRGFGESDISMYLNGMTGDSYYYAYNDRSWETLVLQGSKELEGAFHFLYDIITETNAAIDFIQNAEDAGKDVFPNMDDSDRKLVKRYKGELLFMRAVAYWYLARTWAPPYDSEGKNDTRHFVLRLHYVNSAEELQNPQLATVGEVYDAIVSDLKNASECLPETYANSDNGQRMRVNKYAAEAMLARVLFYMGRFSETKTYLDDVISQTSLYDLNNEPYEAWNKTSGEGFSKEVIWEMCWDLASNHYDRNPGIMNYYAYNTRVGKASGYIAFAMSYYALQQIGWMDQNYQETEEARSDKRYTQLYKRVSEYSGVKVPLVFLYKYFRGSNMEDAAQRRANRPMIRLADLYIMRSEINWLNNDKELAAADLNVVRKRAGLPDINSSILTEKDIENERIKELAGENADRIYWLIALHKDIPIGNRDPSKFQPIKYPYSKYYYQIPLLEQQTNNAYSQE